MEIVRLHGSMQLGQHFRSWVRCEHSRQPPPIPFCFLPDFQPITSPQPPLPFRLRSRAIGPINLPLADRGDGLLAPGFHGRCGCEPRRQAVASLPTPALSFCFLPDLTRVKFGSACLPVGGRYRAPPPRQPLPNFQPLVSPQPPFACGLRLQQIGPINLPVADCSDGPLAPDLRGRYGRPEATPGLTQGSPVRSVWCRSSCYALSVSCRI